MDTLTDPTVLAVAAGVAVGVLTGAVMALKAVAPHTKTTLDDKAVALGEKALPYAVRVLEWLRGRVK
jgi:xanthosine utilization system XapX-like protein